MRVHVVSDVHGNVEALARAGDGADALVVLGDLIDFIDYHDHGGGILGAVFGADTVREFARLRREAPAELPAFSRALWSTVGDAPQLVEEAVREQYARLFAAMPAPTYATPGNVDTPDLWPEFAGAGVTILDGEVAEIGGLRFGFVGGGLLPPGIKVRRPGVFRPYLRTEDDFAAGIARLSDVDVMCTHIPPDVPELSYDVLARRFEFGSPSLLDLIMKQQPRWAVFGHVHQPLAPRMRVGNTECANVGHFQRTGRPYVLRW
jgi:Icc-related predicted phosphoesterase